MFLVKRVGSDTDVQIRQGKNLLGVSYDVDLTDVVTRIMPTGEDKDGNLLYLPEVYIDSPNIGNYPHPKWIHLAVSEAKEVTEGDEKKSKDQCYTEMRNAVQAEYDKDVYKRQGQWHPRPAGILQQDEGLGRLGQILGWLRRRND